MSKKYDPKSNKCQEAIRLKYENDDYAVISKKINVSKNTILKWFARDGLLHDTYNEYADKMNAENDRLAMETIGKEVGTAAKMLVGRMASATESISLKAILAVIERRLGKPVQPIRNDGDAPLTELSYEQRLEKIRQEYGERGQNNKTQK